MIFTSLTMSVTVMIILLRNHIVGKDPLIVNIALLGAVVNMVLHLM